MNAIYGAVIEFIKWYNDKLFEEQEEQEQKEIELEKDIKNDLYGEEYLPVC
jgi:hypothetical protein